MGDIDVTSLKIVLGGVSIALALNLTSTAVIAQPLSPNETKALALSETWQAGQGAVAHGPDGKVMFLFGEVQPSIVCSPLQVCDIELEAGEVVSDVLIGDTVRWKVEPALSGSDGSQRVHLVIKPSEAGLHTSMVVTTSRRTYHLQLRSSHSEYMPRVGFDYTDDVTARLAELNGRLEASLVPGAGLPADQLNFAFQVAGSARWKPIRVYSDGRKTYIQFPTAMSGQDAPVLFVVSGKDNRLVNYRFRGDMMVVDYDIDQGILVSGSGAGAQKVTISRAGGRK